jgi:hypothetical protein
LLKLPVCRRPVWQPKAAFFPGVVLCRVSPMFPPSATGGDAAPRTAMFERVVKGPSRRPRRCRTLAASGGRFEQLEDRDLLAIGAYDVPQRDLGDYSQFGVVDVAGGTGTLMANGRYIVTAAHVVEGYRDPDTGSYDSITVKFFSGAGDSTSVEIPGENIHVHPSWRTLPSDGINQGGADGVDLALLELPSLAPYGNGAAGKGFELRTASLTGNEPFMHVGFGYTGTGTTGQAVTGDRDGNGYATGADEDHVNAGGQAPIQRIHFEPGTRGGIRLSVGDESVLLGPAASAGEVADALGQISTLTEGRLYEDANPARVLVAGGAGNPFAGAYELVFWNRTSADQVTIAAEGDFDGLILQAGETLTAGRFVKRSFSNTLNGLYDRTGRPFEGVPPGPIFAKARFAERAASGAAGNGDSGGPLFVGGMLAGVTAFGFGRAAFGDETGYTRISSGLDFIQQLVARPRELRVNLTDNFDRANDGTPDSVVVRYVNATDDVEILIGDVGAEALYFRGARSSLTGLFLVGSRDSETFQIDPALYGSGVTALPVSISGQPLNSFSAGVDAVVGPNDPAVTAAWSLQSTVFVGPDGAGVGSSFGQSGGRLTLGGGADVGATFINIDWVVGGAGADLFTIDQQAGGFQGTLVGRGGTNRVVWQDLSANGVDYGLGGSLGPPLSTPILPTGQVPSELFAARRVPVAAAWDTTSFSFDSAIQELTLTAGSGPNLFRVQPGATAYDLTAGEPTAAGPGRDQLEIVFTGLRGRRLTWDRSAGAGSWVFAGIGFPVTGAASPVSFTGIEKLNYFPIVALGAETGRGSQPVVQVIAADSGELQPLGAAAHFLAYEAVFKGGVSLATGDVDGDGIPEIITTPGVGRLVEARVFDVLSGRELVERRVAAYPQRFREGGMVTVGDVNGDGRADVIIGPARGHMPVKVFTSPAAGGSASGGPVLAFHPFALPFRGGVSLATGDFNADGRSDLVVGSGPGSGARVMVFDVAAGRPAVIRSYAPFGIQFRGGVNLSAGDFTGDGVSDIAVAARQSGDSLVEVLDGTQSGRAARLYAFATFGGSSRTATAALAARDLDGDGLAELISSQGTDGRVGRVRQWTLRPTLSATELAFAQHAAFGWGFRMG